LAIIAAEIRNMILQKYGTPIPRFGVGLFTLFIFIAAKCQLLSMLADVKATLITAPRRTVLYVWQITLPMC